jgi:hypothetical protein
MLLYIDRDIVELVEDFRKLAVHKNTSVEIEQFRRQDSRLRGLGNGQLSQAVAVESGMGPGKAAIAIGFLFDDGAGPEARVPMDWLLRFPRPGRRHHRV